MKQNCRVRVCWGGWPCLVLLSKWFAQSYREVRMTECCLCVLYTPGSDARVLHSVLSFPKALCLWA